MFFPAHTMAQHPVDDMYEHIDDDRHKTSIIGVQAFHLKLSVFPEFCIILIIYLVLSLEL